MTFSNIQDVARPDASRGGKVAQRQLSQVLRLANGGCLSLCVAL